MSLRIRKTTLGLLAGVAVSSAQPMTEYRLTTAEPPQTAVSEEIVYRPTLLDDRGFNRAVKAVHIPTLTVYHPVRNTHRGAAIVICPGGGYEYLAIDRGGHALARYFQQHGLTAAVLKYRLPVAPLAPGDVPACRRDAFAAVRFVRAAAGTWDLDARRIGILGLSAGGHLAGSAAIFGDADDGSRPDFAALLSPVVTLDGPLAHQGSRTRLLGATPDPALIAALSLEKHTRPGLPPFFLAHALDDQVVDAENSRLLAASLETSGVPTQLLLVSQGGHDFASSSGANGLLWRERFIQWLDTLP